MNKAQYILTPYYIGSYQRGLEALSYKAEMNLNKVDIQGDEAISLMYRNLSSHVQNSLRNEYLPVSISGDCLSAIGVLAGLQASGTKPSLIWIDAHGDFHTWETTESCHLGGMPLAMICGLGSQEIVNFVGVKNLDPSKVFLTAARSLEVSERSAINSSGINFFPHLPEVSSVPSGPIYLHFDTDVLDPSIAPSMHYPADGGLRYEELSGFFSQLRAEAQIAAVSMSAWDTEKDADCKTAEVCMGLLEELVG